MILFSPFDFDGGKEGAGMAGLNTTELAEALKVTKGRISQYVSEGKLNGCFSGDGRARRFDLAKVAAALGKRLDAGQMLGNGAGTKRVIRSIMSADAPPPVSLDDEDAEDDAPAPQASRRNGAGASELSPTDSHRYDLARTQKAEEEARRLRRMNAEAEGQYVLAEEVTRRVAQAVGQEVREFEAVLRDGARKIADEMGVEMLAVRKLLLDSWRAHRDRRSVALNAHADGSTMTEAEKAADI